MVDCHRQEGRRRLCPAEGGTFQQIERWGCEVLHGEVPRGKEDCWISILVVVEVALVEATNCFALRKLVRKSTKTTPPNSKIFIWFNAIETLLIIFNAII